MKVLMVCTGNICRSPMAEWLLRSELEKRGCPDVEVSSAGTWALWGSTATTEATEVMRARGIDMSLHRSQPLEVEDALNADLIVVMTSVHVREVGDLAPDARDKVVLVKQLARTIQAASPEGDWPTRLRRAPRPRWERKHDLDDPLGLPLFAYEKCLGYIEEGLVALAETICPPEREKGLGISRVSRGRPI
jgi:protein-tyrosine-phosphatase